MTKKGPEFYDNKDVLQFYMNHRSTGDAPNENMEHPLLWELIGNPNGLTVLDLGCGDARIAHQFRKLGAKQYLGVEGSQRMFELAQKNLKPGFSEVQLSWLEDLVSPAGHFDLVISSLALHYIENLKMLFDKICESLKPAGRFIFSVEHPVITSDNRSLDASPVREAWLVDNYFVRGERQVQWMGDTVTKYHRTIEDYLSLITESGFSLQSFREADPQRENFKDTALWERRRRIPLFLILAAKKI